MIKHFRIIMTIILAVFFWAALPSAAALPGADALASDGIPSDYRLVADNASYEMYLYEETMSVILRNKATGVIMRSTLDPDEDDGKNNRTWLGFMQSGVVVTAIQGTVDTYQVDLINEDNSIIYQDLPNGFSAKIYFPAWKFGFTVFCTLEGDDFVVRVPSASIVEDSANMFISTISLFPFMGYTYLDSHSGYMLIPDGNGALIYLNDKHNRYTTGFSQMIYGNDAGFSESSTEAFLWDFFKMVVPPAKVVMPVFGMAHTDKGIGYLAVVEDGEKRASIEAHPNGAMIDYNRCFTRFIVRRVYIQPLNNSNSGTMPVVEEDRTRTDLVVRYMLLSDEDANYVGMGVAYRNYLLENGLIEKKDTSYRTRVDFVGTDYEPFLLSTRAVTMTTTENVHEMYDYFQDAGIGSLLSVYNGWQRGGVYRIPINRYRADRAIGGTRDLTRLIHDAAESDYQIYLHNDALRVNNTTNNSPFNTVRMVNRRNLEINTYQQVYRHFSYLLPERTNSTLARFSQTYMDEGLYNLALAQLPNNLFSYSRQGSFYSRFDTAESYEWTLQELSNDLNLIMEEPFAYLWQYTDAYLSMPLDSSHYMYQDESVPFMSIVLKGIMPLYSDYVNFEANINEFKLKMIEAGVYPSFLLTYQDSALLINTNSNNLYSTLFDAHKETVVLYDREFRELARMVGDAHISNHAKLTESVSVTVYDNGFRVYVNYASEDVVLDESFGEHGGVAIAALSATIL